MGQKSSKQKHPWDVPPPGMFPYPQNPYANPPFIPPGYQPTPGPYAAFPPNAYGQAAMGMPQPQLSWLPQDKGTKKGKSRRSRPQSEQYTGAPSAIGLTFPEPNPPQIPRSSSKVTRSSRRRASTSATPSAPRRSGTPFIPPGVNVNTESDSDDSDSPPLPQAHRRTHSAQPEVTGQIGDVLRPLTPPGQSAFGPTGQRPRIPLKNPLPPPPRDLYEMTPYKSLLALPQTTALLTASYNSAQQPSAGPASNGVTATTVVIPPGGQGPAAIIPPGVVPLQDGVKRTSSRKGKGMSGLFRAMSGRKKAAPPPPPIVAQTAQVQFIPVFVDGQKKPGSSSEANSGNPNPSTGTAAQPQPQPPGEPRRNSAGSTRPPPNELPTADATPILFDQVTQNRRYFGFMNHSPHRVMYKNKVYPTATHLHEALKYLPEREDIADEIRATVNVLEVYEQSARFADYQRQDWADVFMEKMEEVLVLKFRQHADLREMLVGDTGERPLVYADPLDSFWGIGPSGDGANELGSVLMRVRKRLREEGGLR